MRTLFAIFVLCSVVVGDPITQPSGLNPGDPYRLAFVTTTLTDALSDDIDDYNAIVAGDAAAEAALNALGTTWKAIASTPAVAAIDNTATNHTGAGEGVPIYFLNDVIMALNYTDLWDGSIQTASWTESDGTAASGLIWAGTDFRGGRSHNIELGAASGESDMGITSEASDQWIQAASSLQIHPSSGNPVTQPLYGISGTLTAVPEPSPILALGLIGLVVWKIKSRTTPPLS